MSDRTSTLEEVTKQYLFTHDLYKLNEYRNSILLSVNIVGGSRFLAILDGIYEEDDDPVVKKDIMKLLYEVMSRTENMFEAREVIEFLLKCTSLTICFHLCINATKALLERHLENAEDKDYRSLERLYRTLAEKKISQYPQQCRMDFLKISLQMVELTIKRKVAELDIELVCDSISDEKDPRNLLTMFELLEKLAARVARRTKEFECIAKTYAVYFPIQFVPPKKDKICIRPLELKKRLLSCFKANKRLAEYSMELLLDSLYSDLTVDDNQSVLTDTLYFLKNCKPVYGTTFEKYTKNFLQVVKMELLGTPVVESGLEKLNIRVEEPKNLGRLDVAQINKIGKAYYKGSRDLDEKVWVFGEIMRLFINSLDKVEEREVTELLDGIRKTMHLNYSLAYMVEVLSENSQLHNQIIERIVLPLIKEVYGLYDHSLRNEGNEGEDWHQVDHGRRARRSSDEDKVAEEEWKKIDFNRKGEMCNIHTIISKCIMPKILINFKNDKISEKLLVFLLKIDRNKNGFFKYNREGVSNYLKLLLLSASIVRGRVIYEIIERMIGKLFVVDAVVAKASLSSSGSIPTAYNGRTTSRSIDLASGNRPFSYTAKNAGNTYAPFNVRATSLSFERGPGSSQVQYSGRSNSNSGESINSSRPFTYSARATATATASERAANSHIPYAVRTAGNGYIYSNTNTSRSMDSSNSDATSAEVTSARIVVKWEQTEAYWTEVALNLKVLTSIYKSHKGMCYPIVKVLNAMVPANVRVKGSNFMLTRNVKMSTKSNLLVSSQMAELLGITLSKWRGPKENEDMDRLVRNIIQVVYSGLEEMIRVMNRKYVSVHSSMDTYRANRVGLKYPAWTRKGSTYESDGVSSGKLSESGGELSRSSSESSLAVSGSGISDSNISDGLISDGNILAADYKRVEGAANGGEGGRQSGPSVALKRTDSSPKSINSVSMGVLHSQSPLESFREYTDRKDKKNRFGFLGYVFRGLKERVGTIDISDSEEKEERNYTNAMRLIYANMLIDVLESACKTLFMEAFERRRLVDFFATTFNYYKNALEEAEESAYTEVFKAKKVPVLLSILGNSLELDMSKYIDHRTTFMNIYLQKPQLCGSRAKHTQSCLENIYYNFGSVELSLVNLETMVVYNGYLRNIDEVFECSYSNGSVLVKCVQNSYKYDFSEITEQVRLLDNYRLTMREYDELFFLFLPISLNYNKGAFRLQLIDIRERYRALYEKSELGGHGQQGGDGSPGVRKGGHGVHGGDPEEGDDVSGRHSERYGSESPGSKPRYQRYGSPRNEGQESPGSAQRFHRYGLQSERYESPRYGQQSELREQQSPGSTPRYQRYGQESAVSTPRYQRHGQVDDEKADRRSFDDRTERLLNILFEKMVTESHEVMPNYTHRLAENYFSKLELRMSFLLILLHRGAKRVSEEHLREVLESMSEMVRSVVKYQEERQRRHERDGVSEYVNWCCDRYLMYVQALLFGVVSEVNGSSSEAAAPLKRLLTLKLEGVVEDLLKISKSSKVPFARILAILTTHVIMCSKQMKLSWESRRKVRRVDINVLKQESESNSSAMQAGMAE
ncbi:conserved hypothetical protein [Theileria orientalis strain Shintoku]|uniref:MMS19 nucleotide excision repair protein n=1 Tax=Theileria orientalis strain Shintoku TaxID=869250 RepID=J4D6A1_THEOR|nr:conserved hypothetical protein [Theileria orientalis strain Shintoku]BAM39445.1 conserved hypothetical protein [Theileria orientalis strain Shintoku]|eukprot:XP_009689746.1 conserved hypothetical protein [Theileria orientalis strain Shintoku]